MDASFGSNSERESRYGTLQRKRSSLSRFFPPLKWTEFKYLCFLNEECDGFTVSQRSKCILHKTATALHFTERRTSLVGIRKRTSTFPKYCEEKHRLKRCQYEPKCEKTHNCVLRNDYAIICCQWRLLNSLMVIGSWSIVFQVTDITRDMSRIDLDAQNDHVNVPVSKSKIKLL